MADTDRRLGLDRTTVSRVVDAAALRPFSTVAIRSRLLPGLIESLQRASLPVFYESQRLQAETAEARADTSGKPWVTILRWITRAELRPRFTQEGVTVDLEPGDWEGEPLPTQDPGITATIGGLSDARPRQMIVWWRKSEDGRHRLTVSYDFEDDNEREYLRAAFLQSSFSYLELSWTHEAQYRPDLVIDPVDHGSTTPPDTAVPRVPRGTVTPVPLTPVPLTPVPLTPVPLTPVPITRVRVPIERLPATLPATPSEPAAPADSPTYYAFSQQLRKPLAYADRNHSFWQDGPSAWKSVSLDLDRRMYYRSTGSVAQYEFLPTDFRLGFDPTTGLPAVRPYVYEDDQGNSMIELSLRAVPYVDPTLREALRAEIQRIEKVGFAVLIAPVMTGALQIDLGLAGTRDEDLRKQVDLVGTFGLTLEFGPEHWATNMTRLSSTSGITGWVFLDIRPEVEGDDVGIPVDLRLTLLHADVVEAESAELDPDQVPRRVVLRNRLDRPVQVSEPATYVADQASDASLPTHVRRARASSPLPVPLPPGEHHLQVAAEDGSTIWNKLFVDPPAVEVEPPAEGWLTAIHEQASSARTSRQITVRAKNLGLEATAVPEYDSTRVSLSGGTADPPNGRLERGKQEWSSRISMGLAELWALSRDPTSVEPYVIEWQSDYADLEGLPQRTTTTQLNPTIQALTTERAGSRYDLLDADGTVLGSALERSEVLARIAPRREAGQPWLLRVPAPGIVVPPSDPTTPAEPPVEAVREWLSVYVQPFTVDFAADVRVATVSIVYTHADGRRESSGPINFRTGGPHPLDDSTEWKVGLQGGDPRSFAYTVDYVGYDGRLDHVSFEDVSDPLIWLARPPAPA